MDIDIIENSCKNIEDSYKNIEDSYKKILEQKELLKAELQVQNKILRKELNRLMSQKSNSPD